MEKITGFFKEICLTPLSNGYRMLLPTKERTVMIDPSMDTATVPPTFGDLMTEKIADLEKQLKTTTDNYEYVREQLRKRNNQVEDLESFLKENHSYMDSDHVEEIASFFNIALEKDYDVEITVRFSGTVSAPLGYDMDDLENDIQANIENAYYGNSSITVDVSEDSVDIDWTEA